MGKIFVGGKEFNPPPAVPNESLPTKNTDIRKLTKKEVIILISMILLLCSIGWLPTHIIYKSKISKLEQKIELLDPLNKIEKDLRNKLDKLEQDLKIDDDDLYKILTQLRNKRKLEILNELEQIQLFKSNQNIINFDFFNDKKQQLKQKELLYHR